MSATNPQPIQANELSACTAGLPGSSNLVPFPSAKPNHSSDSQPSTSLESAQLWHALGFHPIPVPFMEKGPKIKDWQKLLLTHDELPAYFKGRTNIGVLLGDEKGNLDVDLDCMEAIPAAARLLPPTGIIFGHESKPASHYMYRIVPAIRSKKYADPLNKDVTLLEIRAATRNGIGHQTVVPWSTHVSGEPITFDQCSEPASPSADVLQRAIARVAAAALLAKYYPAKSRNETELALAGILARAGWNVDDAVELVLATYVSIPNHDRSAVERVKNSVRSTFEHHKNGDEITSATKLKEFIDPSVVEKALEWLDITESTRQTPSYAPEDWRSQLILSRGRNPFVLQTLANVATTLRNATGWKDTIGYDDFACKAFFQKDAPGHKECKAGRLEDQHILYVTEALQRGAFPTVSKEVVGQAVYAVAMETASRRHPVREYLDSLKWDGTQRLDKWLITYLGAADNSTNRMIGAKFLLMLVARVTKPGCKADYMLVLESPQGEGKSQALRLLMANPAWFTDHLPDLGSKDAALQIQGVWLVEASEMDAMSRADVSRIKAFLTSPVDRLRPPYGKVAVDFPRQCAFAGSTNQRDYLQDETGGRRFWCVPVGTWGTGHIDLASLERDRDQLFAEAVVRFKNEEPWYPVEPEHHKLLAEIQAQRYEQSAWTDAVLAWCENPQGAVWDDYAKSYVEARIQSTTERVTLAEILQYGLQKPLRQITRRDEMTVARILKSTGWERRQEITDAKKRSWFYFRPPSNVAATTARVEAREATPKEQNDTTLF